MHREEKSHFNEISTLQFYVQVPILQGFMKFISLAFFTWPQMRYTKVCENEGMIVVLNTAGSNYFARNIFHLNCEKIQNVRAFYQNVYNRCYILNIVQKHLKKKYVVSKEFRC